jgi:carboxyl-terminal processing protease
MTLDYRMGLDTAQNPVSEQMTDPNTAALLEADLANPDLVRQVFNRENDSIDISFQNQQPGIDTKDLIERIWEWLRLPQTGCPRNPTYDTLIDRTIRNIYDPAQLGNVDELRTKYNCQIKNDDDAIKYADEALKVAGDPFTEVLDPGQVKMLRRAMDGNISGIGAQFGPKKEGDPSPLVLRSTIPGAPAEQAGLEPGDAIIKVNGTDVRQMTQQEAINLVTGPVDTQVKLIVLRDGKEIPFDLTRKVIDFPAVSDKALAGDVAYIRVRDFMQSDLVDEMKAALNKHANAKAYIIDMRDNVGGRVDSAILLAGMFIKEGKVLGLRKRSDSPADSPQHMDIDFKLNSRRVIATSGNASEVVMERVPDMVDKPVIVLVNENSASAAELFAGALRDHGDAKLLGTPTYGKGISQTIFQDMPAGTWLQVTTARYFTPNGTWVGDGHNERHGLKPDWVINNPKDTEFGSPGDVQLNTALEKLREKQGR